MDDGWLLLLYDSLRRSCLVNRGFHERCWLAESWCLLPARLSLEMMQTA
jgi:hypothetical protein